MPYHVCDGCYTHLCLTMLMHMLADNTQYTSNIQINEYRVQLCVAAHIANTT